MLSHHTSSSPATFEAFVSGELDEQADAITRVWLDDLPGAREAESTCNVQVAGLTDTVPDVVRGVAEFIGAPTDRTRAMAIDRIRRHTELRRGQGCTVQELLTEYELLSRLIFDAFIAAVQSYGDGAQPLEVARVAGRLRESLMEVTSEAVGLYRKREIERHTELANRLSTFVGVIAHELKNPLGAAQAGTQMLRDKDVIASADQQDRFTNLVLRNLVRVHDLIDEIRTLAVAPEANGSERQIGLDDAVNKVFGEVRAAAQAKGVALETSGPLPAASVDAFRAEIILVNLVGNAIKYSDPRKASRWVRVSAEPATIGVATAGWAVTIRDNGLGIPAALQSSVFRRPFRGHPTVAEGTGLGLTIVEQVAEAGGWRVTFESVEGGGTSFRVILPGAPAKRRVDGPAAGANDAPRIASGRASPEWLYPRARSNGLARSSSPPGSESAVKKGSHRKKAQNDDTTEGKSMNAPPPPAAGERVSHEATRSPSMIVGVGASAGGLEALTRLVHGLEPEAGLAYVLVQHLARDQESALSELLGRAAAIPVEQARDGARIEANHAYVIPPDTTLSVRDGHLRLVRRPAGHRLHLPIDTFLSSLAEVHGPGAIGVILSGAGSDGARGVEAIKEMGGITFAQDRASAQHPSMPEAAAATGSVDFVLPPEEIAARLSEIGRHIAPSSDGTETTERTPAGDEDDRRTILKLLHRRTGVDFTEYRRGTVNRRVLRRMLVHRLSAWSEYLALVRRDPAELDRLYEDLLIGVTSFFRDPEVFAELRATVFPELIATRPPGGPIRVWVPGCSAGEETYSLAIALLEYLEAAGVDVPIQMFGTDLSEAAVARARAGLYPASIAEAVSAERLRHFFVPDHGRYRIAKQVRDLCVFSRQNLVRDPPFSHLDLISCRNVLIYFEPALQRRVFPIFHYALEPHGVLVLGSAESPGMTSGLFVPMSKGHRIYRRRDVPVRPLNLDFSAQPAPERVGAGGAPWSAAAGETPTANDSNPLAGEIERAILTAFGSHGVVVTEQFEIVHVRGDVAPYLTLRPGSASLDLLRMARPELVMPLRVLVGRASAEHARATERRVALSDGAPTRYVVLDALPIPPASRGPRLFAILFSDDREPGLALGEAEQTGKRTRRRPFSDAAAREVASLREELAATKTYLGEIIEQHGATVEELRSAGEEIQSSNEELQSTNEELETTKEEVQSTNEELTTLNEELRNRNQELGALASDLANVFATTPVPIVIVARDHRIRRFTPATERVLRILPGDIGRPIGDIRLNFALPNLDQLITKTVETLEASEHAVRDERGAWWSLSIRPYQTVDRRVDGAVLVFNDIDKPKRAEERASELSEERGRALVTAEEDRIAELARTNKALAAGLAERDRAQEDRNALLRQLSTAHEDERRHLSRELHDEAGQHLAALALGLRGLSHIAPAGSEISRRTGELGDLAETLGQEIHRIALRLRPKALDDFGLEAAVSGYAQDWSDRAGIAAEVQVHEAADRLPVETESAAYRVVQEALTNVARHSGATHASVLVERRDGYLHVIVEDDGKGFDPSRIPRGPGEGIGLRGLRERVEQLNGTVEIESGNEHGTTLFVRIPIADPRAATGSAARGTAQGDS